MPKIVSAVELPQTIHTFVAVLAGRGITCPPDHLQSKLFRTVGLLAGHERAWLIEHLGQVYDPEKYLYSTNAEDIALHVQLLARLGDRPVRIAVLGPASDGLVRVLVGGVDRVGAFACITGNLTAMSLDIRRCELFTHKNGWPHSRRRDEQRFVMDYHVHPMSKIDPLNEFERQLQTRILEVYPSAVARAEVEPCGPAGSLEREGSNDHRTTLARLTVEVPAASIAQAAEILQHLEPNGLTPHEQHAKSGPNVGVNDSTAGDAATVTEDGMSTEAGKDAQTDRVASAAYERDFDELDRCNHGRWVAYVGDRRVGMADTKTALLDDCHRQGYEDGAIFVARVQRDMAPAYVDWEIG